jgi:chemotaxis protein CheY-P-specific phosphatase CheC
MKIDNRYMDALKETSNIATGYAIGILADTLQQNLIMAYPDVEVLFQYEIDNWLSKEIKHEDICILFSFKLVCNAVTGRLLLIFSKQDMAFLLEQISGNGEVFIEEGNYQKIGELIASSYTNALSTFLNVVVIAYMPMITIDQGNKIYQRILHEINTDMKVFAQQIKVSKFSVVNERYSYLRIILDYRTWNVILDALKEKIV